MHGKGLVQEAIEILRFNNHRIIERVEKAVLNNPKIKNPVEQLEEMINNIKKIDSNPRWKGFRFDPSEGGKCKLKNIEEALAGIACEEQGLLHNLVRDPTGEGEFIDSIKQCWDVKTAKSYALTGEKIFNKKGANIFFKSLNESLNKNINEYFIMNITYLEDMVEHKIFYEELKKLSINKIKRLIIIDAKNPLNSKTTAELLKLCN